MDSDTEEKLLAVSLLSAAARHDNVAVKNLLRNTSANVQDAETGYTPLHAAIASCGVDEDGTTALSREAAAEETVKILFDNGAIWNDLDKNDETPGCIAYRLGLKNVYRLVVDAGVRAELLLSKLDGIKALEVEDEEDEDENEEEDEENAVDGTDESGARKRQKLEPEAPAEAAGAEPKVGLANDPVSTEPPEDYIDHWDSNADYLRSSLRYTDTTLLDSSSNAVMMDWETDIMGRHAEGLLPTKGLRAMNIGHGMGIVDTKIQTHSPLEHHIVEAHPAVLAHMKKNGWDKKPGVTIHEGRWQDVLPKLIEQGVVLDAIYYDTFAEDYKDLKYLFEECVIGLLDPSGRFGFYNGLGADRRVCYDVYKDVSATPRPQTLRQLILKTGCRNRPSRSRLPDRMGRLARTTN